MKKSIENLLNKSIFDIKDIKKKILSGYQYKIKSESLTLNTGKGGILMFLD